MATEAASVTIPDEAERLWDHGQQVAARLERLAEQTRDEDERERLGDLADALRGI